MGWERARAERAILILGLFLSDFAFRVASRSVQNFNLIWFCLAWSVWDLVWDRFTNYKLIIQRSKDSALELIRIAEKNDLQNRMPGGGAPRHGAHIVRTKTLIKKWRQISSHPILPTKQKHSTTYSTSVPLASGVMSFPPLPIPSPPPLDDEDSNFVVIFIVVVPPLVS